MEKEIVKILKRMRELRREEEINEFSHSISYFHIERNKKKYSRKTKHKNLENFF